MVTGNGAKLPQDSPANLPHLQGVSQAGAMEIALTRTHHLRFRLQPSKRSRVDDSAKITLIRVPSVRPVTNASCWRFERGGSVGKRIRYGHGVSPWNARSSKVTSDSMDGTP